MMDMAAKIVDMFDPVLNSEICFLSELPFVVSNGKGQVLQWSPAHSRNFVLVENPYRGGIGLSLAGMEFSGGYFSLADLNEQAFIASNAITLACHIRVKDGQFEYPSCLFSKGNHETSHAYVDLFQGTLRFKIGNGPRHSVDISKVCPGDLFIIVSAADRCVTVRVNGKSHTFPESYDTIGVSSAPYCIGARYEDGEGRALLRGCSLSRFSLYSSVLARDQMELVDTFLAG